MSTAKTYEEKLADRIEAMRITEEAKRQLNDNSTYRRVLRANKVEAARDNLHVATAIAKERAEASLMQRLANATAVLALSEKDKLKLQNASKALNPPKDKKDTKAKAKTKKATKRTEKANGKNGTKTANTTEIVAGSLSVN